MDAFEREGDAFEREELEIEEAYNSGRITAVQMMEEIRELHRDYQSMIEDEVQRAADERRAEFY